MNNPFDGIYIERKCIVINHFGEAGQNGNTPIAIASRIMIGI